MVYRSGELSKRGLYRIALRHAILWWVMLAVFYYLFEILESGMAQAEANPYVLLALAVPALGLSLLGLRRILRYRNQVEKVFYTLTEGGLMIESENDENSMFFPWSDFTMVRRSGSVINMFMQSGAAFQCFLEGVSEPRRQEFFRYAIERVGRKESSQLTPPPAVEDGAVSLLFSATPIQRKEATLAQMLMGPAAGRVRRFRPLVLMVWGLVFIYDCYAAQYVFAAVALLFFLSTARGLQNPGTARMRASIVETEYFVTPEQVLCVKESGRWARFRNPSILGACRMPHGIAYRFSNQSVLYMDDGQPLPAFWPEPIGRMPRRLCGWPLLMIVLAVLGAAVAAFYLSPSWRLSSLIDDVDEHRVSSLVLVPEVEELLPANDVDYCIVNKYLSRSSDMWRALGLKDAVLIFGKSDVWETHIHVSPDGKVFYSKTYSTEKSGDEAEYEAEAAGEAYDDEEPSDDEG